MTGARAHQEGCGQLYVHHSPSSVQAVQHIYAAALALLSAPLPQHDVATHTGSCAHARKRCLTTTTTTTTLPDHHTATTRDERRSYESRDYRGPSDHDNVETFGLGAAG